MNYKRFMYAFIISRTRVFEVEYGAIKENKDWYFATSAAKFNQPKTDWQTCGQCEEEVLFGKPKLFFRKWNHKHLTPLTESEYSELLADIEGLKEAYPLFVYKDENYPCYYIPFREIKDLSMKFKKQKEEK